jgi:hypothetical protein
MYGPYSCTRHQWVRMRTRVQNALHAIATGHGVRRGHTLWNREGQALLRRFRRRPTPRIAAPSSRRCTSTLIGSTASRCDMDCDVTPEKAGDLSPVTAIDAS